MPFIKSNHGYLFMLIILLFCMFPPVLTAKVFIPTEVVSGQVISITKEHAIELDDEFLYYPAKKDIPVSIKTGETISIRYYIDANHERNYIDYTPGENSLEPVPVPTSTTKPKKML